MEILRTVKKKTLKLDSIDIVLTIDEIDNLISLIVHTKKQFIEQQSERVNIFV